MIHYLRHYLSYKLYNGTSIPMLSLRRFSFCQSLSKFLLQYQFNPLEFNLFLPFPYTRLFSRTFFYIFTLLRHKKSTLSVLFLVTRSFDEYWITCFGDLYNGIYCFPDMSMLILFLESCYSNRT